MTVAVIFRPNLAPAAGVLLGGVGLAALWRRQFGRVAALCLGFSAILLTLWHNWYFGGVFVPLSANMAAPNVLMMTPDGYLAALGELVRFDWPDRTSPRRRTRSSRCSPARQDCGSPSRCISRRMWFCFASSSAANSSRCCG